MKPARPPAATPQINMPRFLTASRSLPARTGPDGRTMARPIAIARNNFCIPTSLPFSLMHGTILKQDRGHRLEGRQPCRATDGLPGARTIIVVSGLPHVYWRHEPPHAPHRTRRPPAPAGGVYR